MEIEEEKQLREPDLSVSQYEDQEDEKSDIASNSERILKSEESDTIDETEKEVILKAARKFVEELEGIKKKGRTKGLHLNKNNEDFEFDENIANSFYSVLGKRYVVVTKFRSIIGGISKHGMTYLSWDRLLKRIVIVKATNNHDYIQGEVCFLPKISSECETVPDVIDIGVDKEMYMIVFKAIPAYSLEYWLTTPKLFKVNDVLNIALCVLEALRECHNKGFSHNDINPGNILVLYDDVKDIYRANLLDFGFAWDKNTHLRGSEENVKNGPRKIKEDYCSSQLRTAFFSPEEMKLRLEEDFYMLGAVMFECMLATKVDNHNRPFSGRGGEDFDVEAVLASKLHEDSSMKLILLKALSKDPKKRYMKADEFIDDIKEALEELSKKEKDEDKNWKPLEMHVKNGELQEILKIYLNDQEGFLNSVRNWDLNRAGSKFTLLHWLAHSRSFGSCHFVGNDPSNDKKDDILKNKLEMMEFFVDKCNLSPNSQCSKDSNSQTPLHLLCQRSCQTEHPECNEIDHLMVRKLIELGADVKIKDSSGCTPLFYVQTDDILEDLIEGMSANDREKYIKEKNVHKLSALFSAVRQGRDKIAQKLILYGADLAEYTGEPSLNGGKSTIFDILLERVKGNKPKDGESAMKMIFNLFIDYIPKYENVIQGLIQYNEAFMSFKKSTKKDDVPADISNIIDKYWEKRKMALEKLPKWVLLLSDRNLSQIMQALMGKYIKMVLLDRQKTGDELVRSKNEPEMNFWNEKLFGAYGRLYVRHENVANELYDEFKQHYKEKFKRFNRANVLTVVRILMESHSEKFKGNSNLNDYKVQDSDFIEDNLTSEDSYITKGEFLNFWRRFGTFRKGIGLKSAIESCIDENNNLYPWFHGPASSRIEADYLKEIGQFLIRYKSDSNEMFTFSFVNKSGNIIRVAIQQLEDGGIMDEAEVKSKPSSMQKVHASLKAFVDKQIKQNNVSLKKITKPSLLYRLEQSFKKMEKFRKKSMPRNITIMKPLLNVDEKEDSVSVSVSENSILIENEAKTDHSLDEMNTYPSEFGLFIKMIGILKKASFTGDLSKSGLSVVEEKESNIRLYKDFKEEWEAAIADRIATYSRDVLKSAISGPCNDDVLATLIKDIPYKQLILQTEIDLFNQLASNPKRYKLFCKYLKGMYTYEFIGLGRFHKPKISNEIGKPVFDSLLSSIHHHEYFGLAKKERKAGYGDDIMESKEYCINYLENVPLHYEHDSKKCPYKQVATMLDAIFKNFEEQESNETTRKETLMSIMNNKTIKKNRNMLPYDDENDDIDDDKDEEEDISESPNRVLDKCLDLWEGLEPYNLLKNEDDFNEMVDMIKNAIGIRDIFVKVKKMKLSKRKLVVVYIKSSSDDQENIISDINRNLAFDLLPDAVIVTANAEQAYLDGKRPEAHEFLPQRGHEHKEIVSKLVWNLLIHNANPVHLDDSRKGMLSRAIEYFYSRDPYLFYPSDTKYKGIEKLDVKYAFFFLGYGAKETSHYEFLELERLKDVMFESDTGEINWIEKLVESMNYMVRNCLTEEFKKLKNFCVFGSSTYQRAFKTAIGFGDTVERFDVESQSLFGKCPLLYEFLTSDETNEQENSKVLWNLLLENGAPKNATFETHVSIFCGNKAESNVDDKEVGVLSIACRYGKEFAARSLILDHSSNIHEISEQKFTPLHYACIGLITLGNDKSKKEKYEGIIRCLLQQGADVNQEAKFNNLTPLRIMMKADANARDDNFFKTLDLMVGHDKLSKFKDDYGPNEDNTKSVILDEHYENTTFRINSGGMDRMQIFSGKLFQAAVNKKWNNKFFNGVVLIRCVIFMVFMILMSVSTLQYSNGRYPNEGFFLSDSLSRHFIEEKVDYTISQEFDKTFKNLVNIEEVWMWIKGPLLDGLYPNETIYRQNPTYPVVYESQGSGMYFTMFNRIISPVMMYQFRVKEEACPSPSRFYEKVEHCFPPFDENKMDIEESIKVPNSLKSTIDDPVLLEAFEQPKLFKNDFEGVFCKAYGGLRFSIELPRNESKAREYVESLLSGAWLDMQTRALIVEFTIHNSDLDILCFVRFTIEQSAAGSITTFHSFKLFKSMREFIDDYNVGILYFLIIFLLVLLCFTILEETSPINLSMRRGDLMSQEMSVGRSSAKMKLFSRSKNKMKLLNPKILKFVVFYLTIISVIVLRFILSSRSKKVNKKFQMLNSNSQNVERFLNFGADMQQLNVLLTWEKWLSGISILFICIQFIDYLKFSKNIYLFVIMFFEMVKEYFQFLFALFPVLFGFALTFFLLFGETTFSYRDFLYSMFTSFVATFGNHPDGIPIMEPFQHIIVGSIIVVLFSSVFGLLFINLVIAILNDAYKIIKEEIGNTWWCYEQYLMIEIIKYNMSRFCVPFCGKKDPDESKENLMVGSSSKAFDESKYSYNSRINDSEYETKGDEFHYSYNSYPQHVNFTSASHNIT